MTILSRVWLSLLHFPASGSVCPVLECWFVQEKLGHGGGFSVPMSQEKSLMFIRTEAFSEEIMSELHPPADIAPSIQDPAALNPSKGCVNKPKCEINPFMSHSSMVRWASALTDSAQSPVYLQADWLSVEAQELDEQLTLSNIMRALSASKEPKGKEGEGRLVLAYDSKNDRFTETSETGADIDITGLYETGNASLILEEPQMRHSGTYICTVYLPHLLPQGAVDLEIIAVSSSSAGWQVLLVQCEASGFAPQTLDLRQEFSVTGHRQVSDSTFSQSSRLEQDSGKLGLGHGGDVTCVAKHDELLHSSTKIIFVSAPSIEDSMVMVAVALVLYGMIKFLSWTFSSSGESVQSDHYNL
uniref:Tapasin-related protein n=1 Tax=Cyprinus carpio TaxID=7962 RepID=A0A8C1M9A4_CYPCA